MNLDQLCARHSIELLRTRKDHKKIEGIVRNAIAVLREDGLYAFYLYLGKKDEHKEVRKFVDRLWLDPQAGIFSQNLPEINILSVVNINEDQDSEFLTRLLTVRMLTYALYGLRNGEQVDTSRNNSTSRRES